MAKGKNSKTGDKGTMKMFIGYGERESDSIRLWDPSTERVVVMRDVIWLKHVFYQVDFMDVLELEGELEVIEDIEMQVEVPMQPGGTVMSKDLIVTGPTSGVVMQSGHILREGCP